MHLANDLVAPRCIVHRTHFLCEFCNCSGVRISTLAGLVGGSCGALTLLGKHADAIGERFQIPFNSGKPLGRCDIDWSGAQSPNSFLQLGNTVRKCLYGSTIRFSGVRTGTSLIELPFDAR